MRLRIVSYLISVLALSLCTASHAGTYGRITVPKQTDGYCEYMPIDYVDKWDTFNEINNPITVNKKVRITVTSPKYFGIDWLGLAPLTGLQIRHRGRAVVPIRLSAKQYRFDLAPLPAGEYYWFVGKLAEPIRGLNVCVDTLR